MGQQSRIQDTVDDLANSNLCRLSTNMVSIAVHSGVAAGTILAPACLDKCIQIALALRTSSRISGLSKLY